MIHEKGGACGRNNSMSCLPNKWKQIRITVYYLTVNRHEFCERQMIEENTLKYKIL